MDQMKGKGRGGEEKYRGGVEKDQVLGERRGEGTGKRRGGRGEEKDQVLGERRGEEQERGGGEGAG